MAVSVNMPNRKLKEADPLEDLAALAQIAKTGFDIKQGFDASSAKERADFIDQAKNQKDADYKNEQLKIQKQQADADTLRAQNSGKEKNTDPYAQAVMLERLDRLKKEREAAEFAKTPDGRLQKLSAEQKARLDNATLGLRTTQGMYDALNAGDNTFSLIGDNDFTQQRNLFTEAIGRMQSGGAIGVDEAKSFKALLPTAMDSKEMQVKKLQQLQELMASRLGTLGFKPDELGIAMKEIGTKPSLIPPGAPTEKLVGSSVLSIPQAQGQGAPAVSPDAARAELMRRKGLGAAKLPGK